MARISNRRRNNNYTLAFNTNHIPGAFRTVGVLLSCFLVLLGEHGVHGQIKFGEVRTATIPFTPGVDLNINYVEQVLFGQVINIPVFFSWNFQPFQQDGRRNTGAGGVSQRFDIVFDDAPTTNFPSCQTPDKVSLYLYKLSMKLLNGKLVE